MYRIDRWVGESDVLSASPELIMGDRINLGPGNACAPRPLPQFDTNSGAKYSR